MFMRIVQRVNGLIMAQYIRASLWVKERLSQLVSSLLASITQAYQSVVNLLRHLLLRLSLLVPTVLKQNNGKIVEKIKLALSLIKENKTVQTLTVRQLIQAGSKLAGLAKQLPQHVRQVFKKGQ